MEEDVRVFDFTAVAWESLYEVVDDVQFLDKDAKIIYDSLKHRLKFRSFGEYLKRYIYLKAELTEAFDEIPLKEYQLIIKNSFSDNHTPASFSATTAKLSALSKNWLTQQTVRRNVVFQLGFGLNMSVDDVNMFLTKALQEQEIDPKNPFEVICWYCYHKKYNYLKFEQLWQIYNSILPDSLDRGHVYGEHTIGVRNAMYSICDEEMLIVHLTKLKANREKSAMSMTAKQCFDELYNEARDLIAKMYNRYEAAEYENEKYRKHFQEKKAFCREDITESDIEHIICAAIPTDKHGNLTPSKASSLNEQFSGKRFSRQRISEILSGKADITRFDLITLNFFVFSQKLDEYPDSKERYMKFQESTDIILEKCFLGKMYVQNPYECFVLMCILSDEPLSTYADVWELSYCP